MTANSELVKVALAVSKRFPVFPTTSKKMPSWSNKELGVKKGEGGFKIATQDPARVKELFSHPKAETVSVPMGPMSGLLAIDLDLYKGQHVVDWHEENLHWLENTLCHETQSGGRHYIFEWTDKVRFPATLAAGVDVKGHGGYVVFPPSGGYTVLKKLKMKPFPHDVLRAAMVAKGGTGNVIQMDSYNSATDADLIEQIEEATELYPALRSLAYRMTGRRQTDGTYPSEDEVINTLLTVMDVSIAAAPGHARHDDWVDRRGKIPELVKSAMAKHKNGGIQLTPTEIAAINQGESLIETEKVIAKGTRQIGPQRETKASDIEKRVTARKNTPPTSVDTNPNVAENSSTFVSGNANSLNENVIPQLEWVLPRMIPEMGTVSLAGMSNVGKTRWLAALVMALAVGDTKRMGLPQCKERISTVWVANEERTEDIFRRLKAVALQHGDKESADFHIRGKAEGMMRLVAMNEVGNLETDEDAVAEVVDEIRSAGSRLVIFDPYVTLSDAADENSAASAAALTKAFLLITSMTSAALIHAHHTPKDRNRDADWVRGDASAWRGSGAIYSSLDCGFTLSNWMPKNGEQRNLWKANHLTAKLSRFIVLDTGKIREGEALDPVVMELVPQEMAEGEGDPIGVCRLADEAQAGNALLNVSTDIIAASALAYAMVEKLGEGEHRSMAKIHNAMKDHLAWPNGKRLQGRDLENLCSGIFTQRWVKAGGDCCVKFASKLGKGTEAKWAVVIKKEEPKVE